MKITLYIRSPKPGRVTMDTRLDEEPCYDTPRVSSLANEIRQSLDNIIADCQRQGYVANGKYTKTDKRIKCQ